MQGNVFIINSRTIVDQPRPFLLRALKGLAVLDRVKGTDVVDGVGNIVAGTHRVGHLSDGYTLSTLFGRGAVITERLITVTQGNDGL